MLTVVLAFALTDAMAFPATGAAASDVSTPGEPCGEAQLANSAPELGATDVPLDVTPLLSFFDSCGLGIGTVQLFEAQPDTTFTEVTGLDLDVQTLEGTTYADVRLPADLLADTDYELRVVSEFDAATVVPFSTGSGVSVGLAGLPSAVAISAMGVRVDGAERGITQIDFTAEVTPADDPDGPTAVFVRVEAGPFDQQSLFIGEEGSFETFRAILLDQDVDEVCVRAAQRDATGVRTEWSEPSCIEVDGAGRGCDSISQGAASLWAMALGLVGLSRRRATVADRRTTL